MQFPKFNLQEFEKSEGAQRQKLSAQLDNICRRYRLPRFRGTWSSKPNYCSTMESCFRFFCALKCKETRGSGSLRWLSLWLDWAKQGGPSSF